MGLERSAPVDGQDNGPLAVVVSQAVLLAQVAAHCWWVDPAIALETVIGFVPVVGVLFVVEVEKSTVETERLHGLFSFLKTGGVVGASILEG